MHSLNRKYSSSYSPSCSWSVQMAGPSWPTAHSRWDLSGAVGDKPTVPSSLPLRSFEPVCFPCGSSYSGSGDGKSSQGGVTLFFAQPPSRHAPLGPTWLLSVFPHLWQEKLKPRTPVCFSCSVLLVPPWKSRIHRLLIFNSVAHSSFWEHFPLSQEYLSALTLFHDARWMIEVFGIHRFKSCDFWRKP